MAGILELNYTHIMSILLIVGIVIAGLIVLYWLHHLIARVFKLNPKWGEELEEIETVGWWGPFYINKNDKRLFLPKRWGWGWTINLGKPAGIAINLIIIGFVVWAITTGH